MTKLAMVAAVGRNGAIGSGNRLPWRLSSDLRHFRALTMGKPVVMGRRTFESIGRPLPGRAVVVVSAGPDFSPPEGVERRGTLDEAIARAGEIAAERNADAVMVAGGGTLYRALMARADRLHITEVDLSPEADTFFPAIAADTWREVRREACHAGRGDDAAFTFVDYARRR